MGYRTQQFLLRGIFLASVLCTASILFPASPSFSQQSGNTEFSGTFRPVFTTEETRQRDGSYTSRTAMNARIQARLGHSITGDLRFRARAAGRFASDQGQLRFLLRDYTGGSGSYPAGTVTIDEYELTWTGISWLTVTAGRFQGRFPLAGFIPKGMDRYYGANLSISHTDGLWLRFTPAGNYRIHLIASRNGVNGSSHAARAPLTFTSDASRISWLLNIEHRNTSGLWVQRELSVSLNPQTFTRDGARRDYLTISSRAMMRLPVELPSGELWAGGELALVPYAPEPPQAGIPVDESRLLLGRAPTAWQVSAYLNDLLGSHKIGVLYGETDPHWLVSSSFAPNTTMAEIRYRYTFSQRLNYEMRYRFRTDLYKPDNADFTRQIRDFYARFTLGF